MKRADKIEKFVTLCTSLSDDKLDTLIWIADGLLSNSQTTHEIINTYIQKSPNIIESEELNFKTP